MWLPAAVAGSAALSVAAVEVAQGSSAVAGSHRQR